MLVKINRLLKDRDFKKVFQTGRSYYGNSIGVKNIKNDLGYNRFGILISSKISKKAVERNRLKRQIRQIIKLALNRIKPGYDIVIIITSPIVSGKKYKEIESLILNNFKESKLLK